MPHGSPAIVYSLSRNVNLFALRCAALPLVFVVFSPPYSPRFFPPLVDCNKIKAALLEESEYFRCREAAAFHTTCVVPRDGSLLSFRLGWRGPWGSVTQTRATCLGVRILLYPLSSSHFHFTAFEPKINGSK